MAGGRRVAGRWGWKREAAESDRGPSGPSAASRVRRLATSVGESSPQQQSVLATGLCWFLDS